MTGLELQFPGAFLRMLCENAAVVFLLGMGFIHPEWEEQPPGDAGHLLLEGDGAMRGWAAWGFECGYLLNS